MNHQTQNTLTVFLFTLLLAAAGYGLMPGQAKGAIFGAATGGAIGLGQVQQSRRLRQLAAKHSQLLAHQHDIDSTSQAELSALTSLIAQVKQEMEPLAASIREHEQKINRIEKAISHRKGANRSEQKQIILNRQAMNSMQQKLDDLAAELNLALTRSGYGSEATLAIAAAVDELNEEDFLASENTERVMGWLNDQGIEVNNFYQPDPVVDDFLDDLSLYLGDNYMVLRGFHQRLKSNIGTRFRFDLRNFSALECSIHHEFLSQLRASSLLSFGRFFKERSDYILASTHNRKDVQIFLTGDWFERFIYGKTIEILDAAGVDYQCLRNPIITYPNENGSEVDLFFLINSSPLLIECKSGQNYDEGIEKFVWHRDQLGLLPEHAIFVVLDIDPSEALLRTRRWDIPVVNQNEFARHIKSLIKAEDHEGFYLEAEDDLFDPGPIHARLLESQNSSMEEFLKSDKLNLAPEYRLDIFSELVGLFEQDFSPMNFHMITKNVRDRMADRNIVLSRHKIHETLNALLYSNCFHNQQNRPERNIYRPIFGLESLEPEILERKAMEYYARQILNRFNPNFFETEDDIQAFEFLTMGQAPSPDQLQKIKQRWFY